MAPKITDDQKTLEISKSHPDYLDDGDFYIFFPVQIFNFKIEFQNTRKKRHRTNKKTFNEI